MTTQPTLTTPTIDPAPLHTVPTLPAVQCLAGDAAVADTTANIPHPYEDGVADTWISSTRRSSSSNELASSLPVTLKATGELVGAISLFSIRAVFERAEMGYWIGVPYWNKGYCSEAANSLIGYGFNELGLNRVFAEHMTRNLGSGRVMQKAGMTYEGTLRQHIKKW